MLFSHLNEGGQSQYGDQVLHVLFCRCAVAKHNAKLLIEAHLNVHL